MLPKLQYQIWRLESRNHDLIQQDPPQHPQAQTEEAPIDGEIQPSEP